MGSGLNCASRSLIV